MVLGIDPNTNFVYSLRLAGNRLVFLLFYVSSNFLLSYFTIQYPEVLL